MSQNYNVILVKVPENQKISILKAVRAINDLGLKEAKDIVESAPISIVKTATKEEAEKLKLKLKNAGAIVTIEVCEGESSEKLLSGNLVVGENISFLDAMQQIKEQIAILRKKELRVQEEISCSASKTHIVWYNMIIFRKSQCLLKTSSVLRQRKLCNKH